MFAQSWTRRARLKTHTKTDLFITSKKHYLRKRCLIQYSTNRGCAVYIARFRSHVRETFLILWRLFLPHPLTHMSLIRVYAIWHEQESGGCFRKRVVFLLSIFRNRRKYVPGATTYTHNIHTHTSKHTRRHTLTVSYINSGGVAKKGYVGGSIWLSTQNIQIYRVHT